MSVKPLSRKAVVASLAVVGLGLTGCADHSSSDSSGNSSSGAPNLVSSGKLTWCTQLSYKPFEYKDASGQVIGFDKDIADLVAKKLNVTATPVDIPFDQITSGAAFAAKKCDMSLAAITINDKRQAAAPFSSPYFDATQALLAKTGSGVKGLSDLKGKKVGVQTDTTGQDYAKKYASQYGYTVVTFDDAPSELAAVLAGKVDAGINDNGVVLDYAKSNPTTKMVTEFKTGEKYGIQTSKTNGAALLSTANEVLKTAKKDGTYTSLYKKWFKVAPPADALK